jgi:hypothetical protein
MSARVTQETNDRANEFMTPMEKMIELIDDLRFSDDQRLTDGLYLSMMNTIQEIHKLKTQVKTTTIYREAERQAQATVMQPRPKAKDMKDDPRYMSCPSCKKWMTKRHFREKHSKSKTCSHTKALRDFNRITNKKINDSKSFCLEEIVACLAELPLKGSIGADKREQYGIPSEYTL